MTHPVENNCVKKSELKSYCCNAERFEWHPPTLHGHCPKTLYRFPYLKIFSAIAKRSSLLERDFFLNQITKYQTTVDDKNCKMRQKRLIYCNLLVFILGSSVNEVKHIIPLHTVPRIVTLITVGANTSEQIWEGCAFVSHYPWHKPVFSFIFAAQADVWALLFWNI